MAEPESTMAASVTHLRRFANLLDSSIRLPGGFRIGISGIIGLVPGIGDAIASVLTAYIILVAVRLKVSGSVLVRMLLNMLVDFVIGIVPLVGDAFDFAFKANVRNVRLLDDYQAQPHRTTVQSRWILGIVVAALALMLLLAILTGIAVARFFWQLVG